MTAFFAALGIIIGALLFMGLFVATLYVWEEYGWRLGLLMATVMVLGWSTEFAIAVNVVNANSDQSPCIESHQVVIKGAPYTVCDERATPVER